MPAHTEDLAFFKTQYVVGIVTLSNIRWPLIRTSDQLVRVLDGDTRLMLNLREKVCLGELDETPNELVIYRTLLRRDLLSHAHARICEVLKSPSEAVDIAKVMITKEVDCVLDGISHGNNILLRALLKVQECLWGDTAVFKDSDQRPECGKRWNVIY